ncbi:YhdP family protein [Methylobacterium sp. sgz302541]|uniref:YhdP family protein n=1 Tax=unclassified Methylobacterium TaxID=2615210 RepID=UPI003D359918
MVEDTAKEAARNEPCVRRRRGPVRRWSGACLLWLGVLVLVAAAGIGVGIVRLTYGPLRIDGLSERVGAAIAERIGPGWTVSLRDSALELDSERSLALRVSGLDIRNPQGAAVVKAPLAVVSLDTWGLARLAVQPRSIEFRDMQMTALVHRDGSIAFAASEAAHPGETKPHTLPSVDPARGTVSPISAAVASIFGVVLDSAGVVGALDRARITDARLTLVDEDGRERAVFEHVNGLFGRDPVKDARLFELRIDGPHGEWRFGGTLREAGGAKRAGVITLDDLPVTDLLLLSGQSRLPVTTDLKVSARADVALDGGRIEDMKASLRTSDGNLLIEEKDFNPVTIESVTASASWDEIGRALKLDALDYRGAGNSVHLSGAWTESPKGADSDWTASLTGRDATLRGAGPQDAPVKVATIDAHLTGRAGGVAVDDLRMTGEKFGGRITGTIGTSGDDDGLTLHIVANDTELRTGLRLWPEHIAPGARDYLVDGLRSGRLDSVDIVLDMSAAELAAATRGDPMPDQALRIAFSVSDATLQVSTDAPPLSRGRVSGALTGQTTTIRGVTADIRMDDGRALSITDGSFVIPEITPEKVVAKIGLHLGGGADALAGLLQTKLFKSLSGMDMDPATIKGIADLRIDFPLNLKHVPDLPDMPVTLTGTLADLSVDKAMGKDRLEAGRFALAYDRNGFSMKGDGRLAGAPLTAEMRLPKAGAPGEATVTLLADDAFRARKGLPSGPQLSGPIPVKAVIPLGRPGPGKPPVRVEADLARAGIDGLMPGFVKAAGKPGKLAFSFVDNGPGNATELREIALDAGSASARGSATLGAEGGFERAEMTSVKLSPGDDMRVTAERNGNGYRVSVKGAVGDARPFLKSLGGPEQKGAKDPSPKDIDADIALSILAGFNDEALTNASMKLALRGRDLRSASIQGRFRASPFVATVSRGERGIPVLAVESADAGATLRFVDVYRRMQGGKLAASINLNDGPQAGVVQIRNFALRNEPALSSIVSQGGGEVTDPSGRRRAVAGDGDVGFDRMRANFVRTGSRVDFRDAAISNAAMGFTLGGYLDTGRERTDINGTFVPLYGLNNVVAQVPLFGPLLAGGHNEGLFGVNFRVSGKLPSPDVSVNPLSAVAPGFLRKLFSAGGGNDAFADGVPGAPPGDR